jgi:hypothetical protein
VRRAREALRQQRSAFQGRQRAWKQRSARATLEQLVQVPIIDRKQQLCSIHRVHRDEDTSTRSVCLIIMRVMENNFTA